MPSVAYIQLLRAGVQLGSFTAKDLADETALPLETVRTMLKRQSNQFEDVGGDPRVASARQPGRPARRYQLRDPDGSREEVLAAGGLTGVNPSGASERSTADRASSILDLARANLQVALTEDIGEESTAVRIETAQRTATVILDRDDTPPEIGARAHEYIALSHIASGLLLCDGQHRLAAMAAAADHGAKAFELDSEIGRRVTRLLLAAAVKSGVDPPVAETTTTVAHHELFQGDVGEVELAGQTFRVPRYAMPLMRSRSPAGLVVRFSDTDTPATVARAFEHVANINVPIYVALEGEQDSAFAAAVQRATVNAAAYWMPANSLILGFPTSWIANAFDKVVNLRADQIVLDAIERLPD